MPDDLDTWLWRYPLPREYTLRAAVFGNGKFVAVGEAGTILYSEDLSSCNIESPATPYDLRGIAYGEGIFVAVGDHGTILTSPDAVNWTPRLSGTVDTLNGAAYGEGRFVAVGNAGTILSSINGGESWSNETFLPEEDLNAVAYIEALEDVSFVAVGSTGLWFFSDVPGNWWVPVAEVNDFLTGVTVSWVSGFDQGAYLLNIPPLIDSPTTAGLFTIFSGNSLTIAPSTDGELFVFYEGIGWISRMSGAYGIYGITCSPDRFLAVGNLGMLCTSTDGAAWTNQNGRSTYAITDVVFGDGILLATATDGHILASIDGETWERRSTGTTNQLNGIAYGNGIYVAVGVMDILRSINGSDWTIQPIDPPGALLGVAYGAGKFVAVGENGGILTSDNGNVWTPGTSGTLFTLRGITYCNSFFVAVGLRGTILFSVDGIDWTDQSASEYYDLYKAAYGNGRYVAVGLGLNGRNNSILTSVNGIDWLPANSGIASPLRGIAYANGDFVAAGIWDGAILTSPDGVVWTARDSGTLASFTTVAASAQGFIAAGLGGVILQSGSGAAPAISVTPVSKDFGNEVVGGQTPVQSFTVTNTGTAVLNVGSLFLNGADQNQFHIVVDQATGASLLQGASAVFSVRFGPVSPGYKTANVRIPSNDPGTPLLTVPLSGTGIVPSIQLTPSSAAFGEIQVGDVSQPLLFTVRNMGSADLLVSSITIQGNNAAEFIKQNDGTTGQLISAGGSRTFQVVFSPTSSGLKQAAVLVVSNDPASPAVFLPLTGVGQTHPFIVSAPSFHYFGSLPVGVTSAPQRFAITNGNTLPLILGIITIGGANSGSFALQNDAASGRTLLHGDSGTFETVFTPAAEGQLQAAVLVPSNDPDTPILDIPVSGIGTAAHITVTPDTFGFGEVVPGDVSLPQTFTVTNTGAAELVIGTLSNIGPDAADFLLQNDQSSGRTLAPGMSSSFQAVFRPVSAGPKSADIQIPSNASGTPVLIVTLTGNGAELDLISIPPVKAFPPAFPGSAPVYQLFTIFNRVSFPITIGNVFLSYEPVQFMNASAGGGPASAGSAANTSANTAAGMPVRQLIRAGDTGPFFIRNDNVSGRTLQPGESATLEVAFVPVRPGVFFAFVNIPSDDQRQPLLVISVSGAVATGARITVRPFTYSFKGGCNQPCCHIAKYSALLCPDPCASAVQYMNTAAVEFTVTSVGSSELVVTDVVLVGRDFRSFRKVNDNVSGKILPPGASANFELAFMPCSPGCREAVALIYSNDLLVPVFTVWLYGLGRPPDYLR